MMKDTANDPGKGINWGLFIMVPVCLVKVIYFLVSGLRAPVSPDAAKPIDAVWFTPKTARADILETKVMVGSCFICHAAWIGIPDPDVVRPRFAHGVIQLEHAVNDRCYNCHLIQDRNKYTANDGSGIMHTNVQELCARCHGIIYKDWLGGTHGLQRGKWRSNTVFDTATFKCTECHDPHAPKFQFTPKGYAPPPVWDAKYIRRMAEEIH